MELDDVPTEQPRPERGSPSPRVPGPQRLTVGRRHHEGPAAATPEGKRPLLEGRPIVRAVPISAHQLRALESLEHAFFALAADFQRDYGVDGDGEIAGGLFRIWSTLGTINACWKEEAEDLAVVEGWRYALEQIRDGAENAQRLAAEALR